jgi:hypothetical protein
MPSGLKIFGALAKFGYKKFQPKQPFLKSSLAYRPATISNFPNEPKIYSFLNKENEAFFMWSFIYDQLKIENDWFEDSIQFSLNYFYRNSDSFLIPEVDSFKELYHYNNQNTFTRPIIYTVDNRVEYGGKRFIISNAGVLFSIHEFLENKLLGYDGQIDIDAVKIIREKTLIGTLGASFELEVCHLVPFDS